MRSQNQGVIKFTENYYVGLIIIYLLILLFVKKIYEKDCLCFVRVCVNRLYVFNTLNK